MSEMSKEIKVILDKMVADPNFDVQRALEYIPPSKDARHDFKTCEFHFAPERE